MTAPKSRKRHVAATARGEDTRERILAAALAKFRRRGFDKTTMRDIAAGAGVALGAAYYYFPSKDAIVLAYYEQTQRAVAARAARVFAKTANVRERLGVVMHARFEAMGSDARLLTALFRSVADPSSPGSVFSPETAAVREASMKLFEDALATSEEVAEQGEPARRVLVLSLWSLQMGLLLYFIHDPSPKHERTRALTDAVLDLVVELLPMVPVLGPTLLDRVADILENAGLAR